jgi:cytoskeleton protein RodZ
MASIGETLRQERHRQNLDVAQLADRTKIGAKILEAIEAEQWDRLPGTFFAKSFIRQYAAALGVDADKVEAELERLFEIEKPATEAETEAPMERFPLPPVSPRLEESRSRRRQWLLSLFALGVVALCYGVYALWLSTWSVTAPSFRQPAVPPPATAESRAPAAETESKVPPSASENTTSGTPAESPISAEQAPQVESGNSEQSVSQESAPVTQPAGNLLLNLAASEETWLSLWVDGRQIFSGILAPGETKTIEGTQKARVYVGNAGGLEIHLNGKPVGPLGKSGEVRVVDLTREGIQIHRGAI